MGARVSARLSRLCRVEPMLLALLLLCTAGLYYNRLVRPEKNMQLMEQRLRHLEDSRQEMFVEKPLPLKTNQREPQPSTADHNLGNSDSVPESSFQEAAPMLRMARGRVHEEDHRQLQQGLSDTVAPCSLIYGTCRDNPHCS